MPFTPPQWLLFAIALAAFLVYVPFAAVAAGRLQVGLDYKAPRGMFDRLPDWAQRATWAHQNAFEVFMLFAAAALMVYVSGRSSDTTTALVIAFLGLRLTHSVFYILNIPTVRSLAWAASMGCIGALMFVSLGL